MGRLDEEMNPSEAGRSGAPDHLEPMSPYRAAADGRGRDRNRTDHGDADDRDAGGGRRSRSGISDGTSGILAFMLVGQLAAAGAFLGFIVPQFKEIFSGMKVDLPLITQTVFAASDFMVSWWFVVAPVAVVGVGFTLAIGSGVSRATDSGPAGDGGFGLALLNLVTFFGLVVMIGAVFVPMLQLINTAP